MGGRHGSGAVTESLHLYKKVENQRKQSGQWYGLLQTSKHIPSGTTLPMLYPQSSSTNQGTKYPNTQAYGSDSHSNNISLSKNSGNSIDHKAARYCTSLHLETKHRHIDLGLTMKEVLFTHRLTSCCRRLANHWQGTWGVGSWHHIVKENTLVVQSITLTFCEKTYIITSLLAPL